jgi:2'-5' RNA ligase
VSADAPISGFVGLVIEPDAATIRAAYELAAALLPPDAEQVLTHGDLPHVTLTQCALRDVPRAQVASLIARLDQRLKGTRLPLERVVPFPGGFVFWTIAPDSPERPRLQAAHEEALTLAESGLDPTTNARIVEGTARATGGDAQLVANAQRYGYAFVNERYLPHITLGFAPGASFVPQRHAHVMTVERVVLARLGRLGRVEEVYAVNGSGCNGGRTRFP